MKRRGCHLCAGRPATTSSWIYDYNRARQRRVTAYRYDRRIRAFCERLDYGSERGTPRNDLRLGLRVIGFERRVTVAFTVRA